MRSMNLYLILCQFCLVIQGLFIWTLNDQQFYSFTFSSTIKSFEYEEIMIYGMWSRYTPLSTISQTGPIGIFDSHCYHLNSALESENKRINFIYYDCINIQTMAVNKIVQFISKTGQQYKYEIKLDSMKYEYFWYFFCVHIYPHQKSFTYYLLQGVTTIDIQKFEIQFPYLDENLLIVFGGGLIIKSDEIILIEGVSKLSYYPGSITLLQQYKGFINKVDLELIISLQNMFDDQCYCQENQIKSLPDIDIYWMDIKTFASTNINCDSFVFQTWIKIQKVISDSSEFLYKLIKLSGNFENQKLRDDNLSAMQLFYKFSTTNSQLKFSTYSYNFPYYNLDFSNNPFLIEQLFDIPNINSWHFIMVILRQNIIEIQITFFNGHQKLKFGKSFHVNQFHMIQYKLQYGNILQSSSNYLVVNFRNSQFINCILVDKIIVQENCHHSCQECDGPTNTDCLSCSEKSKRIYISTHKACVCPYNSIDDEDCKDHNSFNLNIRYDQGFKCSQGPSFINENVITCLECINNPLNWIKDPYCQTNLYLDRNDSPAEFIKDISKTFYVFDGINLKSCNHYSNNNLQTIDEVFVDYHLSTQYYPTICSNSNYPNECQPCNLIGCIVCGITQTTKICLICQQVFDLRNGICIKQIMGQGEQNKCQAPYYVTSMKGCNICQIENCQYCFEYESNNLQKCTLYNDFQPFQIDEFHKVGCSLCQDGFIFDFNKGKCIYQKSSILNCLRAFINLQGQEICTLSSVDDFRIAPEIINCQKYISYCKQCYQTPLSIIKCIICEDGYSSSVITGHCNKCNLEYTKYCSEGDFTKLDSWMQLLQSFLIQFLPNKYIYPPSQSILHTSILPLKCIEGYELNLFTCQKYCDPNCSVCKKMQIEQGFQCTKCNLNYYMKPFRVQNQGKCVVCPQLCQVCQSRNKEEIQKINPYFNNNNNEYDIYTYRCIKPIPNQNIFIDPYIQIAKYCSNQQCESMFQNEIENICHGQFISLSQEYLETLFNFKYLNEMAYQQFQLIIPYQGFCYWTDPKQENIIKSIFKQKIFSMQFVELVFLGDHSPSFFYQKISVINFDSLRIQDTLFLVQQQLQIYQNNDDNKLQDLIITNSVFFNDLNLPVKLQIISKNCQNINFTNLEFNNLNFLDSNIFEITPYGIQSIFTINKFTIENCIFTNTILFKIKNTSKIIISNLILNNCYFTNSSIANFEFDYNDPSNIQFHYLMIKNSVFIQSSIISNVVSLALLNISILLSKFEFTQIIEFKKDLNIKNISIKGNNFIQSQLIFKSPVKQLESKVIINSLIFEDNFHYNSSIFQTDLTLSNDLLSISFINFYLNQNQKIQLENQSNYLFNINSHNFSIYNLSISNSDNFNYFNLITITNIKVEYAIFVNLQTLHKVPILLECVNSFNINNQLFYIQGFNSLQFISITIKNFKSIDRSFIQIFSNLLTKEQEFINIQDLRFIENTLLKINLRNLFSLISIYSEKSQLIIINNIQFQENVYHQYIDDSSQTTASLLFIISQQSSVIITNLSCSSNILTNSTSSFIYINSKIINISEFQIQKHNILNMTTLYSLFEIKNIINQNQINTILLKVLKIQNTGGVLSFTTEDCTIINGILQYILTLNSKLFNIHTQGKGIIKIKKLEINLIESLDLNIAENEGCISINSQSSLLQLELTNILFTDILNKFASPILFIIPSQNINNIVIKNITIFNCFSLTNLLIKTQFSLMSIKNNKVLIQNVKIIQNKLEFKQYLQKFNTLSLIDRQKILNDNAIINLSGCIIIIKQFRYQGVLSSSILKLVDTYKVQMVKIYFIQIQLILKVDLIHIWHSPNNKYTVMIQDLTFQNITQLDQIEFLNLSYNYNKIEILNQNCSLINEIQIQSLKINDIGFDTFFQQLIQDSNQQGSLIYFQSQSILNQIFLSSIQAMNVNSQQLFNAILLFDLISFSSIDIIEFNCLFNSVNLYGCILAQQSDKLNSIIRITNSFFYKNNGGSGTGIKTKNVKLALYNSKLLNNYAQIQGGGLNLQLDQNEFVIINSQIQLNQANEAGGIYLLGNSNINENNFIKSVISLNKANLSPSNLLELPTHLSLSINQQDMLSIQKYIDNIQINILKLDPYQIIEQGKVIITNLLVLPSNQIIKNYQIFNPNDQSFQKYIQEFSISFKNNLNEKLIQFTNSTCKIQEQIFTYNKLEYTKLPQIIKFNTLFGNFDISQLQFSFDPYMEISQQQQLLIICQPNNSLSELQYGIKIATLKCQLGEFYIQNSCQTCQYKQGYYSVTYNSTKCSIFDKNKFYNITSNQINLKVGYWRPNYYSDDVEYCFKYPNICKGGWFVGDNLCFSGYIGGLCEECDKYNIRGEGYYYKNQYNLQCQLCEGLSNRILLFIVASLWSLGSIILTLSSIEKSNKLFISCKLRQRFSNIIFKLNQDHGSIIIKLFLNYLWIFSAIFSLNINFTFSFNFIDQTSNPSYFMANNLDCFLLQIHNIELIYLRIITMFILMISLLILIYLGFLFIELFYKKKFDASIISITALYLYVSNYAALIKQYIFIFIRFFSLLAKRQISNINYIQGDVSLKFGTSDHIKWMISFIIPGLGLIGWLLPFLLLLLLYVKKDQIESIQFRKHFCYLFNEYNNSNFFWEWVKLAKKTSVIIILTYFETNIYLKATLLGLCLLFYQLYALEQQPYIIQNFNKIDVKAGQICSISIFLAVIKYICEQQNNFVLSFILQMILVLLSIKLSFPFINSLLKLYHKKYKRQFLIQLSKIFNIMFKQISKEQNLYLELKRTKTKIKFLQIKASFNIYFQIIIRIIKVKQLYQIRSLTTLFTSESLPRHKQYTTELHLLKFRQDIH